MIPDLLPPSAITFEADAADWEAPLLPEEKRLVVGAVPKRRREFAAGRSCARRALTKLGWPDYPLLAGPKREPLWPPGVAGSITHSDRYCAAAVVRASDLQGVGIDAELRVPLSAGVAGMVCTERELAWAAGLTGDHWPALIFSAKESLFKAWYPIGREFLDFLAVELAVDVKSGCFTAHILPGKVRGNSAFQFEGRFAIGERLIFTAVTIPALASSESPFGSQARTPESPARQPQEML